MTREDKRIMAVKGLESCIESDENVFCPEDCPFSDTFGDDTCEGNLHKALLEFVKPRVMTKEDLVNWEWGAPVWMETEHMEAWVLLKHTNDYVVEFLYTTVPGRYAWHWRTYGETWRCWTYKPLPDQKEPWK